MGCCGTGAGAGVGAAPYGDGMPPYAGAEDDDPYAECVSVCGAYAEGIIGVCCGGRCGTGADCGGGGAEYAPPYADA